MTGPMISRRALLAGAAASGIPSRSARAQSYPDRPIRLIVPFPPGGPVDVTARILGQPLGPILGQPLVIENRGGASGAIGAKVVAAAEPDGYTLLCGNISSLVVTPAVNRNRDYDPARAFTPVAKLTQNFEVLVVHPDFPAKSVRELIAHARANPGKLNFGSPGPGNASHLAGELFKLKTGIDIVHVPYKGAAEAATAVIGGQVQMFFGDIGGLLPLIREGRLRALALSGETREPRASRPADHDRERRAGLCGVDLYRRDGARGDTRQRRRQTQRRDQPGAGDARFCRSRRAPQCRRASGFGAGFRRVPRQGTEQVERGGAGVGCPDRVKTAPAAPAHC